MTASPPPYDLAIFDCDGVLVDSEVISCRVYAETLTQFGYPITADDVHRRFLGRSTRDADREIEAEIGVALPADFAPARSAALLAALASDVRAIAHVADVIDAVAPRRCVASSGGPEKIRTTLTAVGLYERFAPHIFSAVQVARSKPAPDLFLFAAGQMGIAPGRTIVIEDSPSGVRAARAAGMDVVGFVGGSHCRAGDTELLRDAGARVVVSDMRELPAVIL